MADMGIGGARFRGRVGAQSFEDVGRLGRKIIFVVWG